MQHVASVNYRDRRCIAWAPLPGRSETLSYLFGATCALLAVWSFLSFFRAGVVASFRFPTFFLQLCLANHSAVSKLHPAEGAEICAGCEFPGSCEGCCAVRTPLCAGRCAPCLCCSLFFCCRDLLFPTATIVFL